MPFQASSSKSIKEWFSLVFCGICMGAADIVPGISGGTIAFIMGFYDELLASIKSFNISSLKWLFSLRFKNFFQTVAWPFLSALLLGIILSFITLAHFFDFVLNHEIYRTYLYSAFLGLIVASVLFCAKQLPRWKVNHVVALAIGAFIAYALTGNTLQWVTEEPLYDVDISFQNWKVPLRNYDPISQKLLEVPNSTLAAMLAKGIISDETHVYSHTKKIAGQAQQFVQPYLPQGIDWWIVSCGAIAISAMLLPGISGSYLLTILGMYGVVIGALADFLAGLQHLHFDKEAFLILLNMAIGIFFGALFFSRLVSWLLNRYRDLAIALLTGFMVGALRSVWPFWSYSYSLLPLHLEKGPQLQVDHFLMPTLSSPLFGISCLFALFGFSLVFLIEFLAHRKKQPLFS
jgi:putative membrane protein